MRAHSAVAAISFAPPVSYAKAQAGDLVAVDLDTDGKLDLATANTFSHTVSLFFGDGRADFSTPTVYPANRWPHMMRGVDLDRDGDLDLAIPNNEVDYFTVLENTGSGRFLAPLRFASGGLNTRYLTVVLTLTGNRTSPSLTTAAPTSVSASTPPRSACRCRGVARE